MSINSPHYPETLQSIIDHFEHLFTQRQIPNPAQLAHDTVLCLAEFAGGLQLYIPRAKNINLHIRNAAIKEAHKNGTSAHTLAMQYKLSVPHVHDIISKRKHKT